MAKFDEEKQNKQLEDLRRQEEEDLVQVLAESKYNIPYINLAGVVVENEALRFIEEKDARASGIAPFKIVGKNVHIAIRTPLKKEVEEFKEKIKKEGYVPVVYMASLASLEKVWERYSELSFAKESMAGGLSVSGDMLAEIGKNIRTIKDIEPSIVEASQKSKIHAISKMFEIILGGAIALDASDVHMEAEEDRARLRFRLDGILHDVMFFDKGKYNSLASRIKLLSGLKLTMENKNQDGRFSVFMKGEEINIRTSTVPGAYGESIVMRILNPKNIRVDLKELGIDPKLYGILDREIAKPHGLILVTGPTGSGKTTTLYAFLRRIYSPDIKIITIEDPIEYHLAGITQTQTEEKKGYTFLEGLRAALRQDPDVIMVGEIRDAETAKIAVEAALTGHMVFSTLHTNNAAGVVPRLIDLEVNPKIMASALSASMAQRLVRKLCPNCKKEKKPEPKEEQEIRDILKKAEAEGKDLSFYKVSPDQEIKIWGPVGCEQCNFIGYKGRIGVFEVILTDENIEKIIPNNPSEREIKKIAQTQGILDMKEDGVVKILQGMTSLEEVKGVVDFYED
jgi:type IV pilus assembly protein PilB